MYRHLGRVAAAMGLLRLAEVPIDGTRVRASNGRNKTLTAAKIEKLLVELDQHLERALAEAEQVDAADELLWPVCAPSSPK